MSLKLVNQQQFTDMLSSVARESNRSGQEALKYAMILMLTSGRNKTPLGAKNRKLKTFGEGELDSTIASSAIPAEWEKAAKDQGRKFFEVYYQGSATPVRKFLPRLPRGKNNPLRQQMIQKRDEMIKRYTEIQFRGTAQKSFGWAMYKATGTRGSNLGRDLLSRRRAKDPVTSTNNLVGQKQFIETVNLLGWIKKLPGCQNIEQDMVDSAANRMNAWLEKRWQTGIDKATRAAS